MRPFLYVAGLFRSGTTLVQELLTQKGKSFIFHEPRFGDGWWQFEEHDRRFLRECWGLSLPKFTNIGDTWSYFQNDLGLQIGAKEIRNQNGLFYYNTWQGNMRLLVVERDPADIYISAYKLMHRSNAEFQWRPRYAPFNAVNLYRELVTEVRNINAIWEHTNPLCRRVVNYSDLCNRTTDGDFEREYLGSFYEFAESDVDDPDIGRYHANLKRGHYESKLHGNKITDRSICHAGNADPLVDREARKLRDMLNKEKRWL